MRATVAVAMALVACMGVGAGAQEKKKAALPLDSLYLVPIKNLEGQAADLKEHAGKVSLVVNLASR